MSNQPEKRFRAAAIIFQDGKLLVIERWKRGEHYFALPGGGIEAGESPEVAVIRELDEELALKPLDARLLATVESESQKHAILEVEIGSPELPVWQEASKQSATERYIPRWVAPTELSELPLYPVEARKPLSDFLHETQTT